MFYYHIDLCTGLSELIILISIDYVPTLYQHKNSKSNRVNCLPTQFRYFQNSVYQGGSNVNIF